MDERESVRQCIGLVDGGGVVLACLWQEGSPVLRYLQCYRYPEESGAQLEASCLLEGENSVGVAWSAADEVLDYHNVGVECRTECKYRIGVGPRLDVTR